MNLIRLSIDRPIAVIAAVLLVILFGYVALQTIPIQLAPDVNRPVITVTTNWRSAAPAEIERDITNRQEEQLAGLEGLKEITSRSEQGRSRITLEFEVGTNMDRALLLVANRLDRVASYPDEADQPTLDTAGSEDNAIAWFIVQHLKGTEPPVHEFGDFVEDIIKERIERVPGVGRVNVFGGSERQIEITVEPELLARYRLTVSDVLQSLRTANVATTAGSVDEGKRRYVVRTEGELDAIASIRDVVLRSFADDGTGRVGRVTVGDVADIAYGYKEPAASIRLLGKPALAFNAERQTGANVIEIMQGIREAVDELNESVVPDAGLSLRQVYDETVYINSAIDLVQQNIWVGGSLAAIILLLFLRSVRATLVVSIAIPVSVIGAFVAMAALGRSINVVSLAGLAFAVGMVVDAAIVVLENIYRLREKGHSAARAAYEGASQVWGAVLVSVLTTIMVFIPVLVMQLEAGQLFRDIAVAISVAVSLSLIVSITVIPALSKNLFGFGQRGRESKSLVRLRLPLIDTVAAILVHWITGFTTAVVRNRVLAFCVVAIVTATASLGAWKFFPKLEYLPEGNRNLLFGIIIPPPGYNLDTMTEIAQDIEHDIRPFWATETGPESAPGEPPKIERFFFVATRAQTFLGAVSVDPERVALLKPVLREPAFKEPGTFGFINQPSVFGRGIGGGRKVDLDISGPDLDVILEVANRAFLKIIQLFPLDQGHEWRPNPGLELGAPELRVYPNRLRLADSGLTARQVSDTIDAFNDGIRVAEVSNQGKTIDLVLQGPKKFVKQTQGIGNLPVVTSSGRILPAESLVSIETTAGPTEIRHRERFRTITLEVRPVTEVALQSAIETIEQEVIQVLKEEGLPPGVRLVLSGTADKLIETRDAMAVNLLIALVIVYLVMAVLFESFVYPLIILLSVPIAAVGGIAGLTVLNIYSDTIQPLDMLTMLGFVILIGIVVNNAILLVHQALHHFRTDKLPALDAITTATQNRIRPIFMSTLTSVFGMMPLVFFPGAGSELYRGLGSVVVGGLSLSAIITLLIVPPMMSILIVPLEQRRTRRTQLQGNDNEPGDRQNLGEVSRNTL